MTIVGLLKNGQRAVDTGTNKGRVFNDATQTPADCDCCQDCSETGTCPTTECCQDAYPENLTATIASVVGSTACPFDCTDFNDTYALVRRCSGALVYSTHATVPQNGTYIAVSCGIGDTIFITVENRSGGTRCALINSGSVAQPFPSASTIKDVYTLFNGVTDPCGTANAENGSITLS